MRALGRAALARCPFCGSRKIWRSFGQMVDRCPGCNYRFEREDGYWVGGLIVNIGVAIVLFFLIFVGGALLTWPDVPWLGLQIATGAVMLLGPAILYPQSKTIWVWLDVELLPNKGKSKADDQPD